MATSCSRSAGRSSGEVLSPDPRLGPEGAPVQTAQTRKEARSILGREEGGEGTEQPLTEVQARRTLTFGF